MRHPFRTTTEVHTPMEAKAQRQRSGAHALRALGSVMMLCQMILWVTFFGYDRTQQAVWMTAAAQLAPVLALLAVWKQLSHPVRPSALLPLLLCLLLDGCLALAALSGFMGQLLSQQPAWLAVLAPCAAAFLTVQTAGMRGVSRGAWALRGAVLLLFIFGTVFLRASNRADRLFPLLGTGLTDVLRAAVHGAGSAWGVALLYALPKAPAACRRYALLPWLLCVVWALWYGFLRPWAAGDEMAVAERMMGLARHASSVTLYEMAGLLWMVLLPLSLTGSAACAQRILLRAFPRCPRFVPPLALLAACAFPVLWNPSRTLAVLETLLPFRWVISLLCGLMCLNRRSLRRAAALLVLVPFLSSCSMVTLERQIYPICMCIDGTDEGVRIGVQAPKSGGSSTAQANYAVLTATGSTFEEALDVLAASAPYPLHFGQIRLCLIGYPLAASQPLRPLLDNLLELPTMRPNAYVSIALGSALTVMQNQKPDLGMRLSTHLSLLISRLQREKLLPDSTLANCVRELGDGRSDLLIGVSAVNERLLPKETAQPPKSGDGESAPVWNQADDPLPENLLSGSLPRTSENPVEMLGSAAVSRDRVTGVLNAAQTRLCLRLKDESTRRCARAGEQLQLQILLPPSSPLAQQKEEIRALMQSLQALESDPLLFGCLCSTSFLTQEAWDAYAFRQRYSHADVRIGEK